MNIAKVTMLLLLLRASNQQMQSSEEDTHCGPYGFRCVDSESFQICTFVDLDGQTEAPEITRKCLDHNVCDEDNPAYCTPLDRIETEPLPKPVGKCEKKVFSKRSRSGDFVHKANVPLRNNGNGPGVLNLRNSDDDDPFGFNNHDSDIETTTTATDSDDYPIFNNQQFECESFGYFPGTVSVSYNIGQVGKIDFPPYGYRRDFIPRGVKSIYVPAATRDIYNASMFWHCDHQNKGKGYIVRHMLCSSGRVFNPVHKECVMIGTTRNIRNDLDHGFVKSYRLEDTFKKKRRTLNDIESDLNINFKFSCRHRPPGKYPDKNNCRLYHYCLPKSFARFNELTFLCPDHLAYDNMKETCNRISFERCVARLHPHEYQILHIEVDAIVLQKQKCKVDLRRHSPDCSEYHLCYNDEVVHLKCPDSYRFDENLLTCQPQHLVTCEY